MPEEDEEEIQEMTDNLAAANETSSAAAVVSELDFFAFKEYRKILQAGTKGFH